MAQRYSSNPLFTTNIPLDKRNLVGSVFYIDSVTTNQREKVQTLR